MEFDVQHSLDGFDVLFSLIMGGGLLMTAAIFIV
ncbi:MAG: hypothetical protein RLZZ324_1148, partial [Candidatus Parcubacteria bacterium]